MAYLWGGSEDIDFPNGFPVSFTTGAGRFRSGYARGCIFPGTSTPGAAAISTPFPGGAVTNVWLSVQAFNNGAGSSQLFFGLGQSGQGSKGLYVGSGSGGGTTLGLYTYNGSSQTSLGTSSMGLPASGVWKIDLQVINYGASATVNVYFAGILAITFTGSIAVSGVTGYDSALLGWVPNFQASEVVAADSDTRSFQGLVTMAPNGNGTTQNWSNPAFTNFNPTVINDANSTFVNTTGQDEQATLIDLPAGNFSVPVVKLVARALATTGATSTGLKLGVNNGGTVGVGSSHALTTAFTTYEDYFTNDPSTGSAWVISAMNALQLNLRSA